MSARRHRERDPPDICEPSEGYEHQRDGGEPGCEHEPENDRGDEEVHHSSDHDNASLKTGSNVGA
jgi:hypothetical protein